MGRKALDLTGTTSGRIVVICRDFSRTDKKNSYWKCRCECGIEFVASGINIKSGNTKSCGCTTKSLGGKSKDFPKEYKVWSGMKIRCNNTDYSRYHMYGGRGIKVCDRWQESFLNFFEDMGPCPPGMSIDRVDNDKGYSPDNCVWRSIEEQNNNRGDYNLHVTINGEEKTASQWAKQYGRDPSLVIKRLRNGWDPLKALTTPSLR